MGGFGDNVNFQKNCEAWNRIAFLNGLPISSFNDYLEGILNSNELSSLPVRLGPMTGGIENVGYDSEEQFYYDILNFAVNKGIKLSIGDGCPDEKLLDGIMTMKKILSTNPNEKAAVFIKPYPDEKILERIEWAKPVASHIGIDIDSYNILTMRQKVSLEKKSDTQLCHIKSKCDVPFVIKGIFTETDIELVKKVKPEVAFISNHGGRVENRVGSTADFLFEYGKVLSQYCQEIWVDGGIRTIKDIQTALHLGANQVLIGRPAIQAMINQNKTNLS